MSVVQVHQFPFPLFYCEENIKMKVVKIILLISKELAHKLNKEYGIPFGENGISVSGTRRKYYLCERQKNMIALEKATK